jgi:hypothetical protein
MAVSGNTILLSALEANQQSGTRGRPTKASRCSDDDADKSECSHDHTSVLDSNGLKTGTHRRISVPSPENDPDSVWTIPFISLLLSPSLRSGGRRGCYESRFRAGQGRSASANSEF